MRVISLLSLSIYPMESLYRLSTYNYLGSYMIYLLLKISGLGKCDLHLPMVCLLLQLGDRLFELGEFALEVAFDSLQCVKVSPFPLVFFGVVVGLTLHFFGWVESFAVSRH